jgi:hypothetical protein
MNTRSSLPLALLALAALPAIASAQDLTSPDSQNPAVTERQLKDFSLSVNRTELTSAPKAYGDHLIQLGPLGLSAAASYGYTWVKNLPYLGDKTADVNLQSYSVNALAYLGNTWTFDYSPSWQRYSSRLFRDSFNQSIRAIAVDNFGPVYVSFEQDYRRSDDVLLETGVQTREDTFTTMLTTSLAFNQLFSMEFDGNQNLQFPKDQAIMRDWTGQLWGNFNVMPTLQLGVGLGSSYLNADPGVNSWTNDYNARVTWKASDKLQASASVGQERRHFQHEGYSAMNSTHYSASLLYSPLEGTEFGATLARGVSPTLLRDTLSRSESQGAHFRQRVFNASYLSAEYAHIKSDYLMFGVLSRGDTSDIYTFAAEIPATRHGTLRLSYSVEKNDSSFSLFQRDTKRVGLNLSFRF